MTVTLRQLILLLGVSVSGIIGAPVQATESYIWYFIRHAEKSLEQSDPALSELGRERAQQLARQLEASGIEAIYSTSYQRTQQTAQPLAERLGLSINSYMASEPEALLTKLQQAQRTSLIIGHSNTIPALVRLAGGHANDLSEQDYGDIFVLEMQQGKLIKQQQSRVELP